MAAEAKFQLRPPSRKEELYIEGYGKKWGEKMTFTVGVSYFTAAIVGLGAGAYQAKKDVAKHRMLKTYHMINTIGKTAGRYGNGAAAAGLMFCMAGKMVDLVFEEEIQEFGTTSRNVFVGALTGALYKSTLGLRPMVVGSIVGALAITSVSYTMNVLNERGIIKFRMDL